MFQKPSAYIDPGTGGMIIGSLLGIILALLLGAVMFVFKLFNQIKRKISSLIKTIREKREIKLLLIIILATTLGFGIIINTMDDGQIMRKKVIVLGIDAFDAEIVEKLLDEGKLPNFQKLKNMGDYSRLETSVPPETPVAVGAAITGSNPGNYGIFDFISRDPATYLLKLNLVEEKQGFLGTEYVSAMKGVPFWRITSDAGIPTTVIRWPLTFPPEKINGRMLSGLGTVDIKGSLNSYSFYTTTSHGKNPENVGRVVKVNKQDNLIKTKVFGPLIKNGEKLVESETPMNIRLYDERVIITIDETDYEVRLNEWSDWIRVKFKIDFLRNVHGIFRVYLLSIEPEFKMYVTSIQIDPEKPMIEISYPKTYSKELVNKIGLFYTLGMPEDTKALTENKIETEVFLSQIKQIIDERTKMFWYEFNRFKEGVFAFYFDSGDRLQHIFWTQKTLSENHSNNKISKEIEDYYTEKDSLLGELLSRLDNNTILIIFSDHGFNSFERAVSINTWLVENGFMVLTKKPGENDTGELFKYVDWKKTKAYSLGFNSIYINLLGREGRGIVTDKDEVIDEIIEKLSNLTDNKTGRRVITKLYKGSEIYKGKYAKDAPDIVIGFAEGYRMSWQNAAGGLTTKIITDNKKEWKGDHLVDKSHVPGVIFANFEIEKENPELTDIAPTILSVLGLEIPSHMEGESLFS
jgi:predicted AlkP superfamily phosphohydrolase/phosphomutase